MNLSGVGLSPFEEYVYRALLNRSVAVLSDSRAPVDTALDRLVDLGLAYREGDGTVAPTEPELGLSRLIKQRMEEANAEMRRVVGAWEAVRTLTRQRDTEPAEMVERIEEPEVVNSRVWSLVNDAREVLAVQPFDKRATEHLPKYLGRLGEGVEWRTIVPRRTLASPELFEYALKLHLAGDRHRVTDGSVQRMIIIDRVTAFLPTVPDMRGSGALMIKQSGIVMALVELFERLWERASELDVSVDNGLSPQDRQVLFLLSSMEKDVAAAREMGVGLRTYRRHVAQLLRKLGASNRFQAAILAKERGWV
ncbi:helix-turn-helix transcriptional regulator [Nonomuraea longicatena]|uniref:LuxR family transcriptional regulator n=1 Tax=Nonomuraea longicatena TaxID=83682 RepID=A0ABN1NRZ7_9ACTN